MTTNTAAARIIARTPGYVIPTTVPTGHHDAVLFASTGDAYPFRPLIGRTADAAADAAADHVAAAWAAMGDADRAAVARDCAPAWRIPGQSAALAALTFGATLADYRAVILAPSAATAAAAATPKPTAAVARYDDTPGTPAGPVCWAPARYRAGRVDTFALASVMGGTGDGAGRHVPGSHGPSVQGECTWDAQAVRQSADARRAADAAADAMRKRDARQPRPIVNVYGPVAGAPVAAPVGRYFPAIVAHVGVIVSGSVARTWARSAAKGDTYARLRADGAIIVRRHGRRVDVTLTPDAHARLSHVATAAERKAAQRSRQGDAAKAAQAAYMRQYRAARKAAAAAQAAAQ